MSLILATQAWQRCVSTSARQARDPSKQMLDKMLRVDHAGEYGAIRIYQGQLAVLGKTSVAPVLQEMHDQEKEHLATFNQLLPKYRVRPTVMLPLWDLAGFMLGAGTALLGKEGAMACTVAVESVIGEHYNSQIRALMTDGEDGPQKHKDLLKILKKFRDEELEHHDTGLELDAEKAPAYELLSAAIKVGCKGAIWVSEKV